MEKVQHLILNVLNEKGTILDTRTLADKDGSDYGSSDGQKVVQGALSSLESRKMIEYRKHEETSYQLKSEGIQIAKDGSHEARFWSALPQNGTDALSDKEIAKQLGKEVASFGKSQAIKLGWVKRDGSGYVRAINSIEDSLQRDLKEVDALGYLKSGEQGLKELNRRKIITPRKHLWYSVTKGQYFNTSIKKLETDLSAEMLSSGTWQTASFKTYNFEAEGAPPVGGALHPLLKVRDEFRKIFFEMGFTEMPTSQFVESCFWNFDSLFVPQQHPAREAQDTFYLSDPSTSLNPEKEYYAKVSTAHTEGGYGSLGYRAPWSDEESKKLVLRTHTTARSAFLLRSIASQSGGFKPCKLFSIDRVFRNEATDNTHLAEFHQVEGVVADYDLTLPDLMGFMKTFFEKMGLTNLRFKPAYNPYTEPSMEIFAFHPDLKKWVEIGNSGMFRPEMLEPMGLPKNVRVHGWGLSLERPTMIRYGISNIRTLVGHKVNVDWVENSAAVRF